MNSKYIIHVLFIVIFIINIFAISPVFDLGTIVSPMDQPSQEKSLTGLTNTTDVNVSNNFVDNHLDVNNSTELSNSTDTNLKTQKSSQSSTTQTNSDQTTQLGNSITYEIQGSNKTVKDSTIDSRSMFEFVTNASEKNWKFSSASSTVITGAFITSFKNQLYSFAYYDDQAGGIGTHPTWLNVTKLNNDMTIASQYQYYSSTGQYCTNGVDGGEILFTVDSNYFYTACRLQGRSIRKYSLTTGSLISTITDPDANKYVTAIYVDEEFIYLGYFDSTHDGISIFFASNGSFITSINLITVSSSFNAAGVRSITSDNNYIYVLTDADLYSYSLTGIPSTAYNYYRQYLIKVSKQSYTTVTSIVVDSDVFYISGSIAYQQHSYRQYFNLIYDSYSQNLLLVKDVCPNLTTGDCIAGSSHSSEIGRSVEVYDSTDLSFQNQLLFSNNSEGFTYDFEFNAIHSIAQVYDYDNNFNYLFALDSKINHHLQFPGATRDASYYSYTTVTNFTNQIKKFEFNFNTNSIVVRNKLNINSADSQYETYTEVSDYARIINLDTDLLFTMYDLKALDNIYVDFKWSTFDLSTERILFSAQSINFQLSSSAIYSASELKILLNYQITGDNANVTARYFDTSLNAYQSITVNKSITSDVFTQSVFSIDFLAVSTNSKEYFVRSNYERLDDTTDHVKHTFSIENFEYRNIITIKPNLEWNFSLVTPTLDYTYNPSTYEFVFTNTIPVTYTFEFLSGSGFGLNYARQSNILAIQDVSSDFLRCIGFENCWSNDWVQTSYPYSSISLNYTIVNEGVSSLKLVQSVSNTAEIVTSTIPSGYYYISFSYYITAYGSSNPLRFYYYSNSAWKSISLDYSTLNRWIDVYTYVQLDTATSYHGATTNLILFSPTTSTITAFVDNVHIYQVSTSVQTVQTNNLQIESQFNDWTSYGLYSAPYQNVSLSLWDRTAQSQSYQIYLTTDSNGLISYNFKGSLDEREYTIDVYALNSHFNTITTDSEYYENLAYFSYAGSVSSYTENLDTSTYVLGSKSIKLQLLGSNPHYIKFDIPNADFTNVDAFVFNEKSNISLSDANMRIYHDESTWRGYSKLSGQTNFNLIDIKINVNYATSSTIPDMSSIDFIYWFVFTTTAYTIYLDDIHFITSQKYYFTPSVVSEQEYATNVLGDSWDFSEGDTELVSLINFNSQTTNGSLNLLTTNSLPYSIITFSNLAIDSTFYTSLRLRIKTNEPWSSDGQNGIQFSEIRVNTIGSYIFSNTGGAYKLTTNYQLMEFNLASDSDWAGIISSIRFSFYGQNITKKMDGNETVSIDYIKIFHRDSSLQKGLNFDFNYDQSGLYSHDAYNDWIQYAGSTISYKDDFIRATVSANYHGLAHYFEYSLANFDYLEFALRTNDIATLKIWVFFYLDGTWKGQNQLTYSSDFTWNIIKIPLTSADKTANRIYIREDTSYDAGSYDINYVRLLKTDSSSIVQKGSNYVSLQTENYYLANIWIDSTFIGQYTSYMSIPLNLTTGSHSLKYQFYDHLLDYGIFLPAVIYEYSYTISQNGVMKLIYYNQHSESIPFDNFRTYVEGVRQFDEYVAFIDISGTMNITITDLFDNVLYSNTSEIFEQFKEILFDLRSVKLVNIQKNPVFLYITRSGLTYSEWVLPNEIVKYYFNPGSYNFTILYSSDTTGFQNAVANGTVVTFVYVVTSDTALVISGYAIQDVYNNMLTLRSDLNQTINSSISWFANNITNQINFIDSNITFIQDNLSVIIDNVSLSQLYIIANFTSIFSEMIHNSTFLISQLNGNFTVIQSLFDSNSTLIYNQTIELLEKIAEINGFYKVHFDIVDQLGIGIPFSTFKVLVNGSRIYDQDQYFLNNSLISIQVFDYFDVELTTKTTTVVESQDISLQVDYFEIIFQNTNPEIDSHVKIARNGKEYNFTVLANSFVSLRFTSGKYDLSGFYNITTSKYDAFTNFTEGIHESFSGPLTFTSDLKELNTNSLNNNVVDVSPPLLPQILTDAIPTFYTIFGYVILIVITQLIAYIVVQKIFIKVDKKVDWGWGKEHIQDPIVGASSTILNLGFSGDEREKEHKKLENERKKHMR